MGNSCPVCESELESTAPWAPKKVACTWCAGLLAGLNTGHSNREYKTNEYSPATMFGVAKCFNSRIVQCESSRGLSIFGRAQSSSKDEHLGCWFHPYPGSPFNRHDYATYREWNSAEHQLVLFVPKGIEWLEGTAGPQGQYVGGGRQIYIPFVVAKILLTATTKLLQEAHINEQSYTRFLQDCKAAFEQQKEWKRQFREERKRMDDLAVDHNELTRCRVFLQQMREQLAQPIKSEDSDLLLALCIRFAELEPGPMLRPESEPERVQLRKDIAVLKTDLELRIKGMPEFRALCALREKLRTINTAVPDATLHTVAARLRTQLPLATANHPEVVKLREELQTQINTFYERHQATNATRDAILIAALRARLEESVKTEAAAHDLIDRFLALQILCEASREAFRTLREDIEQFHDEVMLTELWAALDALNKELLTFKDKPSPEFGHRILEAEARTRAATVLRECNTTNLERVVHETKRLAAQVRGCFRAVSLRQAVLVWLTLNPTRGNRFASLPPDIKQALTQMPASTTFTTDSAPPETERVFVVHVSEGYKGESNAQVEMVVTFTHTTTETRQCITIITHHYQISYRIR